jgi:hypothetical protein
MALENVLIRPNILNRSLVSGDDLLADMFFELFGRVFRDTMMNGSARTKIVNALEHVIAELIAEIKGKMGQLQTAVQAWLGPLTSAFEGIKDKASSGGPAVMLQILIGLAEWVEQALENSDTAHLEAKLLELVDIVEKTLGLTVARLSGLFATVVDRVVDDLTQAYLAGNNGSVATNEFMIGTYLRRIYDGLSAKLPGLNLNFDLKRLVHEAMGKFAETGWDGMVTQIREFIRRIREFVDQGTGLVTTLIGGGSVTVTIDPDPVSWYLSWYKGEVIGVVDRFDLAAEADAAEIRFDTFSANFLEHWAHVSSILMDTAESILHFASIERGDISANVINGVLQLTKSMITIAIHDKNDADWVKAYKFIGNWWGEYVGPFGLSFLTAFEGAFVSGPRPGGCARFIFYSTLLGKDVVEMLMYANWTKLVNDAFLSLFTLINADKTASPGSTNQDRVEGFAFLIGDITEWLFTLPFGWVNYGFPLSSGCGIFLARWGVGLLSGMGGSLIGALIGAGIAGEWASGGTYGNIVWKSAITSLLKFPIYDYFVWDGRTDVGKRGRLPSGQHDLATFEGYPPNEESPYFLPYKKDDSFQCAQGNQGFWSHNAITNNYYAVDFAMDHSMEVLASRGGTVSEYRDYITNHSTVTGNFVRIRHDDPTESILPNPVHDKDHLGVAETNLEYYHGAHYGVRYAFAVRGIPKDRIVGTPVKRGLFVMLSGDTGTSAYNHLHVQVGSSRVTTLPYVYKEIGDGGVPKALSTYKSHNEQQPEIVPTAIWHIEYQTSESKYSGMTFKSAAAREVQFDNLLGGMSTENNYYKGYLFRLVGSTDCYLIESFRYTAAAGGTPQFMTITLDRPLAPVPAVGTPVEMLIGVRAVGDDFVVLDLWASEETDEYKGRHIYVWWTDAQGQAQAEYKLITAYDGGSQKATVSSNWHRKPIVGSQFSVGGAQYGDADAVEKRLGFYAPYNSPNIDGTTYNPALVQNFPDGRVPGKYFLRAKYPDQIPEGSLASLITPGINTLTLGASFGLPLSATDHAYVDCHIIIYEPAFPNNKLLQYRRIASYNATTKAITVGENWDLDLSVGMYFYRIGSRSVAEGLIASNVTNVGTTVQLAATASPADNFYKDRYIALENRSGAPVVQLVARKITAYNGTTKVATVDAAWGVAVAMGADKFYRIEPDVVAENASAAGGKVGYWATYRYPAANREVYDPANIQPFLSGQAPFQYLTFKIWQ